MAKKGKAAQSKKAGTADVKIFQLTPIIIKDGGSMDVMISRRKFKDDFGKEIHKHFKVEGAGRIFEVSITGDISSVKGDGTTKAIDISFNKDAEITITYLDQS